MKTYPTYRVRKRLVRLNSRFMKRISGFASGRAKNGARYIENSSAKVDIELNDDELDCFGGIKIIHTPGHTPGHICIFHEDSKTLIAGDALNMVDGKLTGTNTSILTNEEGKRALKSLEKLTNFDIETIICYHGGLYNNNAKKAIENLLETFE